MAVTFALGTLTTALLYYFSLEEGRGGISSLYFLMLTLGVPGTPIAALNFASLELSQFWKLVVSSMFMGVSVFYAVWSDRLISALSGKVLFWFIASFVAMCGLNLLGIFFAFAAAFGLSGTGTLYSIGHWIVHLLATTAFYSLWQRSANTVSQALPP
jgi:hypothetical protein